jgi:hypothetical protein
MGAAATSCLAAKEGILVAARTVDSSNPVTTTLL